MMIIRCLWLYTISIRAGCVSPHLLCDMCFCCFNQCKMCKKHQHVANLWHDVATKLGHFYLNPYSFAVLHVIVLPIAKCYIFFIVFITFKIVYFLLAGWSLAYCRFRKYCSPKTCPSDYIWYSFQLRYKSNYRCLAIILPMKLKMYYDVLGCR